MNFDKKKGQVSIPQKETSLCGVQEPLEKTAIEDFHFHLGSVNPDWRKWWRYIPEIIALATIGLLTFLVLINAIGRYSNWYRVPWAPDIIYVCFFVSAFLGGALGVKYESHVKMGMLVDHFLGNGIISKIWNFIILLSPIAMGMLLVVLGIYQVRLDALRLLEWTQIPTAYFTVVMPLSGVLMIYYSLRLVFGLKVKKDKN